DKLFELRVVDLHQSNSETSHVGALGPIKQAIAAQPVTKDPAFDRCCRPADANTGFVDYYCHKSSPPALFDSTLSCWFCPLPILPSNHPSRTPSVQIVHPYYGC